MYTIDMPLSKSYQIIIKDNLLREIGTEINKIYKNKNIYIITDERVANFYLEDVKNALSSFSVQVVVIKGYEESKSLETYKEVCEKLIDLGAVRGELLVALGGGVIGDLVGFIASTLYRGMPFVQIPTSLLSQVDSSIGGKTGIDFYGRKNILGAFNQPELVLIDPQVLKTLPSEELKNGFGEMVKHALIGSKELFDLLKENKLVVTEKVIYHNLMIKRSFALADEFDNGERMKLNFGHTFGHIIEMKHNKLHGQAVIDGILCILNYGIDHKLVDEKLKKEVINLYETIGLDFTQYDYNEFIKDIKFDKKNIAKKINLILVDEVGHCLIHSVKEEELR